ncbi:hypothetical protein GNY06_01370 [Elizabethkingia argentiflava]|uniref:Uncharacterized protein n=1 Tax=Elizabethkingia argenteiflava TaxID=2681556 RepID=A0A845PT42_9FLAO|nr:hypothetical protein [Elizabethkingia argenteiflava]NAW50096.1 hypothetical protein [Elizabethkingia argenteiflava]
MSNDNNIFGCYVSVTGGNYTDTQEQKDLAIEQGRLFRSYIWGDSGICDTLKKLNNENYGKDLKLALFQFYVNPIFFEIDNLPEIENYRKKEKSIGIPIIVNDNNFFSKSEESRIEFLKESILQKMDSLEEVVKKKKLDTDVELLRKDLVKLLK